MKDAEARMKWWRDAKFGMFIHWGCYSQLGRGEQPRLYHATDDWDLFYEKMADFEPGGE